MKRKRRLFISIVIVVVVFFIGLYVGSYALIHFSFKAREADLIEDTSMSIEYITDGQEELLDGLSAISSVLLYDAAGNLDMVYYPAENNDTHNTFISCKKYFNKVLQNGKFNNVILRSGQYNKIIDVYYIIGMPVEQDEQITGVLFTVSRQLYFSDTLITFVAYFIVFYIVVAVTTLIMLNKKFELDETKQTYVANVTHSLKTPVASIKALAETLYDGVEPDIEVQRQYLKMILQQTDRQSEMIQNILDLSKIQESGEKIKKEKVQSKTVFEAATDKYALICANENIDFEITENFKMLPKLYTNPKAASQILDCLLNNAVKFTGAEGKIKLDSYIENKHAVIIVEDTGIGISPDIQSKIFERFYRGNNVPGMGGSGLGLAIAKEYCISLKEKIWVKSKVNEGTKMHFTVHIE